MRLGLLGPAKGDFAALTRGARYLLDEARAEKVVYLSDDDALDRAVASMAEGLVGTNASQDGLFDRAATRCAQATPMQIDEFVARERALLGLRVFVSLPPAPQRTIELLDGRVVLFVYDKALLDEEDISAASLLVFGKSAEPVVKKVGVRTFLSPGPIGSEGGGLAVLDDAGGGIRIEVRNLQGAVTARDSIGVVAAPSAKMRVQGGSNG